MAASSPLGTKTIAGHLYLSPQSILVPMEFLAAVLTTCFVKLLSSATCAFDHVAGYHVDSHVVFLFLEILRHECMFFARIKSPEDQDYNLYLGTLILNVIFS